MENKLFSSSLFVFAVLLIMQTASGTEDIFMKTKSSLIKSQEEVKLAYPEVPRITCQELKKLMDEGVPLIIIDTTHENLYNRGHIKGAVNIYSDPFMNPIDRANFLSAIPEDRLIVIYCA